jgi:hypothetical protein
MMSEGNRDVNCDDRSFHPKSINMVDVDGKHIGGCELRVPVPFGRGSRANYGLVALFTIPIPDEKREERAWANENTPQATHFMPLTLNMGFVDFKTGDSRERSTNPLRQGSNGSTPQFSEGTEKGFV